MRGRDTAQKKNIKLADEFKDICPPHKVKDLDALIKQLKGNKEKIREQIAIWWDEPQEVEEKWEDVNSKKSKKQNHSHSSSGSRQYTNNDGGDRGGGDRGRGPRGGFRGGRGGHGRGMAGGRGGGADRERRNGGRGGGGGGGGKEKQNERFQKSGPAAPQERKEIMPGPKPVKTQPQLQGAWAKSAASASAEQATPAVSTSAAVPPPTAAAAAASAPVPPAHVEVKPVVEQTPEPVFDVGVATAQDPTPAGFVDTADVIKNTPVVPPPAQKSAAPAGNVWATRGSAHIIQAEKPKPPPVSKPKGRQQQKQQQPIVEQSLPSEIIEPIADANSTLPEPVKEDPIVTPAATSSTLESALPPSVNGANIHAPGWKPHENNTTSSVDIVQPSPVGPVSVASAPSVVDAPLEITESVAVQETIVPQEEPAATQSVPVSIESSLNSRSVPVPTIESSLKPSSVLNMGQWDTHDGEDSLSHAFGFGDFGQDNDVASVDEATNNSTTGASSAAAPQPTPAAPKPTTAIENVAAPATNATVSPARPPPGLGIGMPPMPDQIVHVHELENKMESASLVAKKDDVGENVDISKATTKDTSSSSQSDNAYSGGGQPGHNSTNNSNNNNEGFVQMPPAGIMSQQNYTGQYGMGMYSYNGQNPAVAAPNGFMGVPNPAAPLLSSGVLPQQKQQQNVTAQQQGVGLPQQASLYGAPSPANTSESNTNTADSSNPANPSPNNAGMPPGIPAGMPYNPALFYGQQAYQMGQHHGVGAYGFPNYGGQYVGGQGGFAYQQVMGQGGGYGQPYDDQGHGNHNNNNNHQGGYNKNSGGYRGRNNHNHNNHHHNQYQNQYNPQGHGAYAGQPYNMGYGDFNQRGGYGPGGHMDSSYMQQNSGGYQSGFNQDEGQQMSKGKAKGGNRNFSNPNMHQYQQSQQQQFGGLQGAGTSGVSDSSGNNGLYNQNWGSGGL